MRPREREILAIELFLPQDFVDEASLFCLALGPSLVSPVPHNGPLANVFVSDVLQKFDCLKALRFVEIAHMDIIELAAGFLGQPFIDPLTRALDYLRTNFRVPTHLVFVTRTPHGSPPQRVDIFPVQLDFEFDYVFQNLNS